MAHDWGGIIDYEKAHDRPSLILQQLQNEPSTVIVITQMSTQMSTRISIRMSTWISIRMSSVKNGVNDRETIQEQRK